MNPLLVSHYIGEQQMHEYSFGALATTTGSVRFKLWADFDQGLPLALHWLRNVSLALGLTGTISAVNCTHFDGTAFGTHWHLARLNAALVGGGGGMRPLRIEFSSIQPTHLAHEVNGFGFNLVEGQVDCK